MCFLMRRLPVKVEHQCREEGYDPRLCWTLTFTPGGVRFFNARMLKALRSIHQEVPADRAGLLDDEDLFET